MMLRVHAALYRLKPLHWQAGDAVLCLQAAFQLGNVADGVLPSAFLVGLLVASVVFSELTRHYNAFRMIGALLRCMPFASCKIASAAA